MRVKYRAYKRHDHSDFTKLPLLHVRLKNGKNIIDLDCLVDSGASSSVLNTDIADALEIDLSKATKTSFEVVGGLTLAGATHSVQLQIVGLDNEWIKIEAGFITQDEIPILGHSGFFENYKITFHGYRSQFEIERK